MQERVETLINGRVNIIQLRVVIDVDLWQISGIPHLVTSSVVRHVESVENTINVPQSIRHLAWSTRKLILDEKCEGASVVVDNVLHKSVLPDLKVTKQNKNTRKELGWKHTHTTLSQRSGKRHTEPPPTWRTTAQETPRNGLA